MASVFDQRRAGAVDAFQQMPTFLDDIYQFAWLFDDLIGQRLHLSDMLLRFGLAHPKS